MNMSATSSHPKTTSSSSPQAQPLLDQPQYVVVFPTRPPHRRRRRLLRRSSFWCALISVAVVLLLAATAYLLWPSHPDVSVVRVKLSGLHFHTTPKISLDVTFNVTVRIRNKDLYSISYESLNVSVGYRGDELGFVNSSGEKVKAHGVSYVNASVVVEGAEILSDVILLIEDLVKGAVTFDTVAVVDGKFGILNLFDLPLKTRISCEVVVNPRNQTITSQSCYPEDSEE